MLMAPVTIHRIAQEIQHQRGLLTTEETWAQKQPASSTRDETFRRINFWRGVLKKAEQDLVVQNS
jgi:hypothetical protein